MTTSTTTLNPGSGGDKILTDSLTTVDGGAAPTSAVTQLVKIGSGAAGTFNTASDTTPVSTRTASLYYPVSTNNSSTTQLAASASFTGTTESVQSLQAAQISIICDQPYTVQVQQFMDSGSTKALPVYTFTRLAGAATNENVTLVGDYFRLVVTNNGASSTTTLSISTTFGIMNTQPAALTNEGKFPVEAGRPPLLLSSYNVSGVIAINTVLMTLDCSLYRGLSIQCTAMGTTGVVTPEWSADNTNWFAASILTPGGVLNFTVSASGLWTTPVQARYLRLRMSTATTAGTTTFSVHQLDDRPQVWFSTQLTTTSLSQFPSQVASSDAFANPSVTQIGTAGLLFNGTSWDRQRGMSLGSVTTGDTGAKTATGNGTTITNVGNKGVSIVIVLGTVSGTTPTCVFKVQKSVDGGTNWVDIPGAATASLTASGTYGISIYPGIAVTAGTTTSGTEATANGVLPRTWRMVWTIGGTTPSFTITSISYTYPPN